MNSDFQAVLIGHNIEHILASGATFRNKAMASERAIRTLRRTLARLSQTGHGVNIYTLLKNAEQLVNATKNSRTHLAPNDVTNDKAMYILDSLRMRRFKLTKGETPKIKFKVGSIVRVRKPPSSIFSKSSEQSYDTDVYRVRAIKETRPELSYIVETLDGRKVGIGSFAESQLRAATQPTVATKPISKRPSKPRVHHSTSRAVTRSMTRK